MADTTLAPQGTESPLYNPNAVAGQAGSLDPTLSTASLSGSSPISYSTPSSPPTYPVASLGMTNTTGSATPSLTATPQEQKQSEIAKQLSGLNTQESAKGQFQADQYKTLGFGMTYDASGNIVPDAGTADLQAKLVGLQNEALAIPNQLQSASQGRGITAGGLAPIQSGALRDNAVAALGVSSLIAAKNGQLATAEHLVNNATIQKFGPIEAQIKAAQANLELIKNDPETSLEDKNRAQAQLDIQNKKAADVALQKSQFEAAQAETLKYASVADASTLSKMQAAKSPLEVVQIAAQAGIQQPQTGRYKDTITTTTDASGNQQQTVRVFDTLTGQFVGSQGQTAAQFNGQNGNSNGSTMTSGVTGTNGLKFEQYGLLSKTNFNENNSVDQLAQRYLDQYIKNGSVPTASSLGRSLKPGALAELDSRARDLYFQATGTPLPDPKEIAGYKSQLVGNNKLLNNLNVQEGTIGKNAALLIKNLNENNLNQNSQPLNALIDGVRNMLGDPDVAQFLAQNVTVGNELGSLLSLKNAQGTTVHDKLEAAGLINKNDNTKQIAAKVKILLQEAVNAHDAIQSANAELYKQTDPLLQNANNPARTQTLNGVKVEKALTSQGLHYDALLSQMNALLPSHPGTQPALDAKTGQPAFATPDDIKKGLAIPL